MMVLWITLLLFQQAYSLIPIKTVRVGEQVTFTCNHSEIKAIQWWKQSAGEAMKLIVVLKNYMNPGYEPEFPASRFDAKVHGNMSSLRILNTTEEDEGMYHCGTAHWLKSTWNSTYLSVKGSSERTSNLSVVQSTSVSDPVRAGASMTLQCSVLSDSESKTCPGGHRVIWFRAGSDKSYPDVIYTDEKRRDECEQRSDSEKSCVYHFSKNVSSSDAGTYYCAVAACGRILFGDGAKVDVVERTAPLEWIVLGILTVCLFVSVAGNVSLLCKQKALEQHKVSEADVDSARLQTDAEDGLNYAALNFSVKATRGRKKREFPVDGVYAQVRC